MAKRNISREKANLQLRSQVVRVREQERLRISQVLHDELGQNLALLKLKLTGDGWAESRSDLVSLVQDTLDSLRRIVYEIRPPLLDDFGLKSALEQKLSLLDKSSGIQCSLEVRPKNFSVKAPFDLTLFRLIQESLNNVIRHSGARTVVVRLNREKVNLNLEVEDNGKGPGGIAKKNRREGFGIPSMKERVRMLNGRFSIGGVESGGTKVRVSIPLNRLGL
ncbi:MAG: sensor histidine kinase [Bdellovibrionia bacterium]